MTRWATAAPWRPAPPASRTASSTTGPEPNSSSRLNGSGSQRLYGFRDILVLKLVKRLLDTGISLQQIRTAVEQLRAAGIRDLAGTTLMSDGASVYLCTSNDEVIDLVSRGQGVFGIAVGKVLREVESTLVEFDPQTVDAVDELAARRAARSA
jgi:DNA-binding transcriptional MerR regulator